MAKRPAILFDLASLVFLLLGQTLYCFAEDDKGVLINEIAWMGTEKTASDEWIELYNNANYGINLNGWSLRVQNSFQIELKGTIPAKGFYLLERSDDQTLAGIPANAIFKGSLANKGQKISLYNKDNTLINEVDCSQGWFKGDNASKKTMERVFPQDGSYLNNWQTSIAAGGTPKAQNSQAKPKEIKTATFEADIGNYAGKNRTAGLKTKISAFLLAISSGIIIIFLKRTIKN